MLSKLKKKFSMYVIYDELYNFATGINDTGVRVKFSETVPSYRLLCRKDGILENFRNEAYTILDTQYRTDDTKSKRLVPLSTGYLK
jgi:hypothetical protein